MEVKRKKPKIEFAWKIMSDHSDKDNPIYAYRKESWIYIAFCLLLRKPLPPVRITGRRDLFEKQLQAKENKLFLVCIVSVLVQLYIFYINRIDDYNFIWWMSLFTLIFVSNIPDLAVAIFRFADSIIQKRFKS